MKLTLFPVRPGLWAWLAAIVFALTVGVRPASAEEFHMAGADAIPEGNPGGTTWQVNVTDGPARVDSIVVEFFIQHYRITDLTVTLQSPRGEQVVLTAGHGAFAGGVVQNYRGVRFTGTNDPSFPNAGQIGNVDPLADVGYGQNIYLPDDVAQFDALYSQDSNGTWTLTVVDTVADAAPEFAGLVAGASIDFNSGPLITRGSDVVDALIPDDQTPLSRVVGVQGFPGTMDSLRVRIYLFHADLTDLQISLQPPVGPAITLKSTAEGGFRFYGTSISGTNDPNFVAEGPISGGANLYQGTFTPVDVAAFDNLYGQSGNGNWTLTIVDQVAGGVGALWHWALEFRDSSSPSIQSPLPADLPPGEVGVAYPDQTFTATGGNPPYTWSVPVGSLPGNMTLDSGTGVLNGAPDAPGTYTFTVRVTDNDGRIDEQVYTIEVFDSLQISAPPAGNLPAGGTNDPYGPVGITATGGKQPYTWSDDGNLPPGLAINPTTGEISGTPTTNGTYNFTITVTDDNGWQDTRDYTIEISDRVRIASPAPGTLTSGYVGEPYSVTFTGAGGTPGYTWSVTGNVPDGLALDPNTGVLSGPPTTLGSFTFTIRVTDTVPEFDEQTYTIEIVGPPVISAPAPGALPDGTQNAPAPYGIPQVTFTVTDGGAPFTWSATGLPPGLQINTTTGEISGTPTSTGTFAVTVTVTDNGGKQDSESYTITINAPVAITTASLPDASDGQTYDFTPTTSGGTAAYSWTMNTSPFIPTLTINPSTGQITGTAPTTLGTYSVQLTVTDRYGSTATRTLTLSVVVPTLSSGGGGCACRATVVGDDSGADRANRVSALWMILGLVIAAAVRRRQI